MQKGRPEQHRDRARRRFFSPSVRRRTITMSLETRMANKKCVNTIRACVGTLEIVPHAGPG